MQARDSSSITNDKSLALTKEGSEFFTGTSVAFGNKFLKSQKLLVEAKEQWDIDSGQIIVADPKTGEILRAFPDDTQ